MAKKTFELIDEQTCYQGYFSMKKYTVKHSLYAGGMSEPLTREIFNRGNCVAVLLYDPDRDEVVIIEQFRIGAIQLDQDQAWLLEIVAGAIEENETPEQVARREAIEEAGCEIQQMEKICEFFTSPGGTSELLTLFCGKVDTSNVGGLHGLAQENEDIRVSALSYQQVCDLFTEGRFISAIPIIAIQWLQANRQQLRERWKASN